MDSAAYVDESFRSGPHGLYVLAAVHVPAARADELRLDLLQLFAGRHRRFHWHSEESDQRKRMLEFVAEACLPIHAVSKALPDLTRQERIRAHCLERLLWELRESRTERVILESRQARNNGRDRRTILAAQRSGKASPRLRYEFGLPKQEPLLWMADAIASAVAADSYPAGESPLQVLATVVL